MDRKIFWALFALIFVAAFVMRFWDLTGRPLHHDEGVIGFFKLNILNGMRYTYDPDYHGPFEYFFGAAVFWVFGVSDFTLRAPECLFNILTILLLLPLRKRIGDAGTLAAAGLLAVSPSMVYYAQRAYMDNFFIFFSLALVVCWLKLLETGQRKWLLLGAFDLALLFTTKETAFIIAFIFLSFLAVEYAYRLFASGKWRQKLAADRWAADKWARSNLWWIAAAAVVFLFAYAVIYTTLFFNLGNLQLALEKSFTFWLSRSTSWAGHFKPFYYWWELLTKYEQPVLFLAIAGVFLSLKKGPFGRFCAWWAAMSFAVYSAIPYKTPWLDVHLILPMALVAGIGIDQMMAEARTWRRQALLALPIVALLLISAYVAWDLTYKRYADGDVMLVYVQSVDDYKRLVGDLEAASLRLNGTSSEMSVVATEYWPLPWHLRDYGRVAWWGRSMPDQSAPIVISSKSDYSEIREGLRGNYRMEKYDVRPGVTLYVYYRRQ